MAKKAAKRTYHPHFSGRAEMVKSTHAKLMSTDRRYATAHPRERMGMLQKHVSTAMSKSKPK